jgi:hypothetical protein
LGTGHTFDVPQTADVESGLDGTVGLAAMGNLKEEDHRNSDYLGNGDGSLMANCERSDLGPVGQCELSFFWEKAVLMKNV